MGLFLNLVIVKDCTACALKDYLKEWARENTDLIPDGCQYSEQHGDMVVVLNPGCAEYVNLPKFLSAKTAGPVLLTYIYDEDFWGYYLFRKGELLDKFMPLPEYFEKGGSGIVGRPAVLAEAFGVSEQMVEPYICNWDEREAEEELACENDEYPYGDCWQMVDFMIQLGYEYPEPS